MNLVIEDERMVLEAQLSGPILAVLPRLEGHRRWLKNGYLSCERTRHNLELLQQLPGCRTMRQGVLVEPTLGAADVDPSKGTEHSLEHAYRPLTQPYAHQDAAMRKILAAGNVFALFAEQGTGKTKILIDWCGRLFLDGEITGVLVVSQRGPHRQWAESEIPKHCGVENVAEFWPKKKLPESLLRAGGTLKFWCINYDGVKTRVGRAFTERFCAAHKGKLMILADESHSIKNHRSARFKAMQALKKYSSHRALATGTPIAKDLTDEWVQIKWLDEEIIGIRYVTAFRAEYCIMGGYQGRMVVGHRNVERFKKLVDPFSFRATKDELGILPKQYGEWVFDLTDEQRRLVRQMRSQLAATLATGEHVEVADVVHTATKIQQICSGFILDEEGVVKQIMPHQDNPRLQAMLEWLASAGGKALIWARFRHDFSAISEVLEAAKIGYATYYGATSDKQRSAAIQDFLNGPEMSVLVANPASAGTGLNLQGSCNRVLYYSNSFNAIDRWQSEDRVHRIGTVGTVQYTDLVGKGSPDRYIMRNLRSKKSISDLALGDIQQLILGDLDA